MKHIDEFEDNEIIVVEEKHFHESSKLCVDDDKANRVTTSKRNSMVEHYFEY